MANFFEERDIQAVVTWAAEGLFTFEFESEHVWLYNKSGTAVIEFSFDGANVHGTLELEASLPYNARELALCRRKIWLRAVAPPGACLVQVSAWTR